METEKRLSGLTKPALIISALLLSLIIGYIDYLTGSDIGLSIFYLAPISFMTWYGGGKAGTLMSFVSTVMMAASDYAAGKGFQDYFIEFWNLSVHLGFFVIVIMLLVKLKSEFEERARLIEELRIALEEVKRLSGLLPICASCKKIRDDKGYWNQLEVYISEHSEAEFSHGLCPDCAKKLYPDFYKDKK